MKAKRSDAERLADVVAVLGEAFRQSITDVTIRAYHLALSDVPIAAVERAAVQAMRDCKFMPTAKELRDLATGTSAESRPMLAWTALMRVPFDPYRHVDFDDPLVNATIRSLGGWPTFIERFTDAEAEKWARKEFLETYARLAASNVSGDLCRPLPGLATGRRLVRDGEILPPLVHRIELGIAIPPRLNQTTPALGVRYGA